MYDYTVFLQIKIKDISVQLELRNLSSSLFFIYMQSVLHKGMTVLLLHCFTVGNHQVFFFWYLFLKSAVAAMLCPSMSPHNRT